jgi:rod shape-determining protein MreD
MGVSAAVFVVVHGVVNTQRRFFFGKSFAIVWLGFALVSTGAFVATWVLVSAFYGVLIQPQALFFQALLTLGCFPLLSWSLLRWQMVFLRA